MKKDITLVIMAAGIGSRYGGGIKQLASVGPSGEIIMDYSVYDALEAGFNKIVFVIRKDLEADRFVRQCLPHVPAWLLTWHFVFLHWNGLLHLKVQNWH